jgi:hypothetical protein
MGVRGKELIGMGCVLQRDLAAVKVQRLFRGHVGRIRFDIIKEMRQVSTQASK